jgi:hypothetical protein
MGSLAASGMTGRGITSTTRGYFAVNIYIGLARHTYENGLYYNMDLEEPVYSEELWK